MMVIPREVKNRSKVNSWSKSVRKLQNSLILDSIQKQVLVGTLLGDACLAPNVYGKNFRLELSQSAKQKAYLDWKAKIFHNWCLSQPHFNKKTKSWRIKTLSHPELTTYHSIFYRDGKKVIPKSINQIFCSTLGLAVWFMDDGTKGPRYGYTLNSQNFSQTDNEILVKLLQSSFGIKQVSLHRDKKYQRIYIGGRSRLKFENLIRPHIIPTMLYKLHS
ncbi:MAG: hypothetical protein COV01_02565 [Candidatus Taylorbacteria bacterium CG10_big_fil_rev_8_21_14_0_10_41_48]|uniref:Homing endonuclease LAGLIDADG domain-containing protein n=1 Tax=Candidatus Taylorbacteria bacterium CG10_big_fil_rev_8_21_14_0_10_41_48 TaxID=1975024 RepID=A0A2M8LBZ4_9BACT|nr:MAG: hypothetical protein COV01_02565 [Candidatus Taylorbacteria bacterium CG10_big_fil_rev_8_21_14_0_10_41_48]